MAAVAVAVVWMQQKCQGCKRKGIMVPDQHRQGKGDATIVS
jgi:hypothetical protein